MRFLVDENLSKDLAKALSALGHDAVAVIDSRLRGSADDVIWQHAAGEDRILITQDLDFPLRSQPRPPGLVLIRMPDSFELESLIKSLTDFIGQQTEDDLVDKVTVVTPGRSRSRRFDA